MTETVEYHRISCGCCTRLAPDQCVCWNHQDVSRGQPAQTCSAHRALATATQPAVAWAEPLASATDTEDLTDEDMITAWKNMQQADVALDRERARLRRARR